jgi:hypothetical protein
VSIGTKEERLAFYQKFGKWLNTNDLALAEELISKDFKMAVPRSGGTSIDEINPAGGKGGD